MHRTRPTAWMSLLLALAVLPTSAGCPMLLATGVYVWEGGNLVDADCEELKQHRVVVFCRPPASSEYRHAGAARQLAERVSAQIEMNVPGVDVVSPREVDSWIDENDSDDFKALGKAVNAERVVHIEMDRFELYKGKTLFQGKADVRLSVYDITDGGRLIWERPMGEFLFPENSAVPVHDRSEPDFQRQYVDVLSGAIARHFYKHDPHVAFAGDAQSIH